jgi:hypothetical protein
MGVRKTSPVFDVGAEIRIDCTGKTRARASIGILSTLLRLHITILADGGWSQSRSSDGRVNEISRSTDWREPATRGLTSILIRIPRPERVEELQALKYAFYLGLLEVRVLAEDLKAVLGEVPRRHNPRHRCTDDGEMGKDMRLDRSDIEKGIWELGGLSVGRVPCEAEIGVARVAGYHVVCEGGSGAFGDLVQLWE